LKPAVSRTDSALATTWNGVGEASTKLSKSLAAAILNLVSENVRTPVGRNAGKRGT